MKHPLALLPILPLAATLLATPALADTSYDFNISSPAHPEQPPQTSRHYVRSGAVRASM